MHCCIHIILHVRYLQRIANRHPVIISLTHIRTTVYCKSFEVGSFTVVIIR